MPHINFSMCSYETKIVTTRSADNLNGQPFCNIKVKWTQYSAQTLFLSRCFIFVFGYLLYIMQWWICLSFIKKKLYEIYILVHLLAKQNGNVLKKIDVIGSSTFCFEISCDILHFTSIFTKPISFNWVILPAQYIAFNICIPQIR